jgi:hypothetical protein
VSFNNSNKKDREIIEIIELLPCVYYRSTLFCSFLVSPIFLDLVKKDEERKILKRKKSAIVSPLGCKISRVFGEECYMLSK